MSQVNLDSCEDVPSREDIARALAAVATDYVRELLPALEAGQFGSSFRFRVLREEWIAEPPASAKNPEGLPSRTIKEVELFEFGPTTWGANPAATAGLRERSISLTDWFYEA